MSTDPFFNVVWKQLVDAPETSRLALAQAQPTAPLSSPRSVRAPLAEARSWARSLLRPDWAPAPDVPFLAFPQEQTRFDVVRALWSQKGIVIEVAQTIHLISIRIRGAGIARSQRPADAAASVAQIFLATTAPVRFNDEGRWGGINIGKRVPPATGRVDPDWPHWEDELRYFINDYEVGFLTLKASGGPTREVIACSESMNRVWF